MSFVTILMDIIWNPDVWLPGNVTWADLEPNDKPAYGDHRYLRIPLSIAIVLLCMKFVLERYLFAAVGISLGIKNKKPKKAPPNAILERAYVPKSKLNHKQIVGLAKQLDWSERQVERWLHLRRSQDRPSTLTKFCESSWRWLYYTVAFSYGVFCLWDKPWLWDIRHCWYGYPYQILTSDCWWYIAFSIAFCWSLAVSLFFDVKRKDFWQMVVHHVTAICIMTFLCECNLHRLGTLVLLVHDCADIFIEAAKMAKYAKYQRMCDVLFVVFAVVWIVTRVGVFPMWILYSTLTDGAIFMATLPAYILNCLFILLLVLHLLWTYTILKMVYKFMVVGQMERDLRSSSSDDISDESGDHVDASPASQNDNFQCNSKTEDEQKPELQLS